jgi:hypothetical protein
MMRPIAKKTFWYMLAVSPAWSSAGYAQKSATRTSSFAYLASTGLLTLQVIEPNTSSLRLQTDCIYGVYGHRTRVAVSGVDIATRSSTTTYDTTGEFAMTATNALNQSESWRNGQHRGERQLLYHVDHGRRSPRAAQLIIEPFMGIV